VGPIAPTVYQLLTDDLREELDSFARENKRVAIVAFGTISKLYPAIFAPLYRGLSQALDEGLLHKVYWAAGETSSLNETVKHPSIQIMHWIPQFSMLQHEATALFVTHGGGESSHEGILAGVPMIAIPILGDQPGNAARIQELGIGRAIHKNKVTSETVLRYVKEIVADPDGAYSRNVSDLKEIARRRSARGLQEAVDLIETIALVGDRHLFAEDRHIHWLTQNNYDVFLFLCACSTVALFITRRTVLRLRNVYKHLKED
jgi:MGT family glycosyltransferase